LGSKQTNRTETSGCAIRLGIENATGAGQRGDAVVQNALASALPGTNGAGVHHAISPTL